MGDLFNLTFETGNLTGTGDSFDSAVTDSGDLTCSASAGLAGTVYGVRANIDDAVAIYGIKNTTVTTGDLRLRFYMDPNGLNMGIGENFSALIVRSNGTWLMDVRVGYDGSDYWTQIRTWEDDGTSHDVSSQVTIADEPHFVEVDIVQATSEIAGDGRVRAWVDDGAEGDTGATLDNYNRFDGINQTRMTACAGLDAGTSGVFYTDELRANDDGSEIGPVAADVPPKLLHLIRLKRSVN